MFRRLMSLLLAMTMVLSMMPVQAFAEETEHEETVVETAEMTEPVREETVIPDTEAPTETTAVPVAETSAPTTVQEETSAPTEVTEETVLAETSQPTEAMEETAEAAGDPTEATEEIPEVSKEAADASSGTCGEKLTWSLSDSGVLTISGTGAMDDYSSSDAPWYSLRSSVTSVVINKGVTDIGAYAFYYCTEITSVTVPAGITAIGTRAFCKCYALTKITIPAGVATIGAYAFDGCTSLTNAVIGSGTTDIGEYAFNGCYNLASVTLPDGIVTIGDRAFSACDALTSVTIPASVTGIGSNVFYSCDSLTGIWVNAANTVYCSDDSGVLFDKEKTNLIKAPAKLSGSYTIPETVTKISDYAFYECTALTDVTVPDSVTGIGAYGFYKNTGMTAATLGSGVETIGKYAFSDCTSLVSVILPDSVITIGEKAFYTCSALTGVIVPAGVSSIGNQAFSNCAALTGIWVEKENAVYASDASGVLHNKEMTALIQAPAGITGSYSVRNGVTEIGQYAFDGCGMSHVTVSDTVTTIGSYAFYNCKAMTGVTIGSSVAGIGSYVFQNCTALQSVYLPDNVTSIGSYAFRSCSALRAVYIPNDVTTISSYGFYNCASALVLYCEATAVASGWSQSWNSYSNGSALTVKWSVSNEEGRFWTEDAWKETVEVPDYISTIPSHAFQDHTDLKQITLPDSVTMLPDYAFYGCTSLKTVNIPERTTSIGSRAFGDCDSLRALYIPASVTAISGSSYSNSPFYGCTSSLQLYCAASEKPSGWGSYWHYYGTYDKLRVNWDISAEEGSFWTGDVRTGNVVIPDYITRIPSYAFYGCTGLTEVTIPASVALIEDYAFHGCTGLTKVTISEGVTGIGTYAFSDCTGLTELVIPDSVTEIGQFAFQKCSGLTDITFGSGLTAIEGYTFLNCTGLTTVVIPDQVTSIGARAFGACTGLKAVYIPAGVTTISATAANSAPFYECASGLKLYCEADAKPEGWGSYWAYYSLSYQLAKNWSIDEGTFRFFTSKAVESENVVIPDSITRIPDSAFKNRTDLLSVTIGSGVAGIGKHAFYGCTGLKQLYIPAGVTGISAASASDSPFYNCSADMVLYCGADSLPSGWGSYWRCYNSSSVLAVNWGYGREEYEFFSSDAAKAADVVIPDSVSRIPASAFSGRTDLTSVVIPDSVTAIGANAFNGCTGLTEVLIGSGVTGIGSGAFYDCTGLRMVYIPESVTSVPGTYTYSNSRYQCDSPFYGCEKLAIFCGGETKPEGWGDYWNCYYFYNPSSSHYSLCTVYWGVSAEEARFWAVDAKKAEVVIPDTITRIPRYAFYNRTDLTGITIPATVTAIDPYAFYGCTGLTSVTIPDGVTSIGWYAFQGCTGLTEMTIPDGVTSIGNNAFSGCTGLTTMTIPEKVASIGSSAFYKCTGLREIWFYGDAPTFGSNAFYNVTATVHYPSDKASWTEEVLQNYGGTLTWIATCLGDHIPVTDPAVEATCTQTGLTEGSHCSACGVILLQQQETPATGHTEVVDPAVKATCKEDGLTEGSHCAKCGAVLVAQEIVPATHTPVIDPAVAPTCTQPGFTEGYHCDVCGEILVAQQLVPAAHTAVTDPAVEATCMTPGLTEGSHCSACGEVFTAQKEIPALGHSYTDGTCTRCGAITGTCGDALTWTLTDGLLTVHGSGNLGNYALGGAPWYANRSQITSLVIGPEVTGIGTYAFAYCTNLNTILFEGDEIPIGTNAFYRVVAEVTYNGTWSADAMQNYGGTLTWTDPCGGSHTVVTDAAVEATCTETGLTEGSHCSVCGTILVAQTETAALGHDMGDWETVTVATCTREGLERRSCSRCAHSETQSVGVIAHDYESTVTVPDCENRGYTTHTCTVCGDSYVNGYTSPLGHAYGDWETVLEKTCTTDGEARRECTRCGHCETTVLEATSHSYEAVVTEAGCETGGYTTHTCTVCGDSYMDSETAALGHAMGEWETVKAPTCTEAGENRRSCIRCGHVETGVLEPAGHSYEAVVTEPNCETGGYTTHTCPVCGDSYRDSETAALGHAMGEWEAVKAPTCTEAGEERRSCTRCGHVETGVLEPAGHSYESVVTEPGCETGGYTTHTCPVCGDSYRDSERAALGHAMGEWETVKAPTCTETGEERRNCSRCDSYESRVAQMLPHTEQILPAVAPTCTEAGLTEGKQCGVCQQILLAQETVAATGHDYVNYICRNCGGYASSSGNLGQDVTWEVDTENGKLIFDGSGSLENPEQTPWAGYEDAITEIVIGEGVTEIGDGIFDELDNLETVSIPDTVTGVSPDAFSGCENLTDILVSEENPVYSDQDGILFSSNGTELICYPAGREDTEYTVPGTVEFIGDNAFSGDPDLETIRFTGTMPEFGDNAFQGLDVTVYYPGGDPTWDPDRMQNYGGTITWVPEYDQPEVIALTADCQILLQGEQATLTAHLNMQEPVTVLWEVTEGSDAVQLIADGTTARLTAKAVEESTTVTVTASVEGGVAKPAEIRLEILPRAQALSVLREDGGVVNGSTVWWDLNSEVTEMTFAAEVQPADARKAVTWTVSDTACAFADYTTTDDLLTISSPTGKSGMVVVTARTTDGSEKIAQFTVKFTALEVEKEDTEGEDPADMNLLSGKNKTLKIYDADTGKALTNKQITWSMDEIYAPYAKIDAKGKITAKKVVEKVRVEAVGAIIGSEATTVTVTVDIFPAVTSLEILQGESMVNGKTLFVDSKAEPLTLTANLYPLDAMEGITWTISDKKDAFGFYTVDEKTGSLTVTPRADAKAGSVTIKATSNDGTKKTATVKLQFAAYAKTVTIDKSITQLTAGDKAIQLTAAMIPTAVTKPGIVWSLKNAADKAYVNLSSSGKITPKDVQAPVDVTVVATSKDGMASDEHTLRILPKSQAQLVIKSGDTYVTKTTQILDVNTRESITLTAYTYGAEAATAVSWTPLTNKAAQITPNADGSLTVKMTAAGSINVTALAGDGRKATVTIKGVKLADSVVISQKKTNLTEGLEVASGKSLDLQAAVTNAASKKVTWSIEKGSEFAAISSSGKLTAVKDLTSAGVVTVRAVADGGAYDEMDVTVRPIAQGVQVYSEAGGHMLFSFRTRNWWVRSNTTLNWDLSTQKDTVAMDARVYPYYGEDNGRNAIQDVTWKSSAPKIAEFVEDPDGNVSLKLHRTGSATITVTAADGSGQKVTFKLNVVKTVTKLTVEDQTVTGGKSLNLAKLVIIDPVDATNKKLTWAITRGSEYATVSSSGSFKAKKVTSEKTVEVTVSSQDGGASTKFNVTITP